MCLLLQIDSRRIRSWWGSFDVIMITSFLQWWKCDSWFIWRKWWECQPQGTYMSLTCFSVGFNALCTVWLNFMFNVGTRKAELWTDAGRWLSFDHHNKLYDFSFACILLVFLTWCSLLKQQVLRVILPVRSKVQSPWSQWPRGLIWTSGWTYGLLRLVYLWRWDQTIIHIIFT